MGFTHDSGLVALSIAIAILGAFTALIVTSGLRAAGRRGAAIQIGLGGVSLGGGIWAMHFIGILAVIAPIETGYNPYLAALSALVAVLFASAALAVNLRNLCGRYTMAASVAFLGFGLAAMVFLGAASLRGAFTLEFWWPPVVLCILIAMQAAGLALWFAFRSRGLLETAVAAIALGLAAASMHYAGMQSIGFLPTGSPLLPVPPGAAQGQMAFFIALGAYAVCGICILAFTILTFRRNVLRGGRGVQARPVN